jgi:hypothetical protein
VKDILAVQVAAQARQGTSEKDGLAKMSEELKEKGCRAVRIPVSKAIFLFSHSPVLLLTCRRGTWLDDCVPLTKIELPLLSFPCLTLIFSSAIKIFRALP